MTRWQMIAHVIDPRKRPPHIILPNPTGGRS